MANFITILFIWFYIWLGIYSRQRERLYRPRCPRGAWAATTTILFWPWKLSVVFWKKWRRG